MVDYPTPNQHRARLRPVRLIVLHTMEVPCTDEDTHSVMRQFQDPTRRASSHWGVGPGVTLSGVPEESTAWATPGCNADGIQIEQSGYSGRTTGTPPGTDWTSGPGAQVVARTADLVRDLCARWAIPRRHLTDAELAAGQSGIIGHVQASRVYGGDHWDPGETYPWNVITTSTTPPTTPTTTTLEDSMFIVSRLGDEAAYLVGPTSMVRLGYSQAAALMKAGVRRVHLSPAEVLAMMEAVHASAADELATQTAPKA